MNAGKTPFSFFNEIYMKLTEAQLEEFRKNGIIILRNLYSQAEIEGFRKAAFDLLERSRKTGMSYSLPAAPNLEFFKGDCLSKPEFKDIILDERVISAIQQLVGKKHLFYFGNSIFHIHSDGFRGYHRDNVDRTVDGPDWHGNYTMIRCGLYLQNHDKYSGGLEVIPGSHKSLEPTNNPPEFVKSRAGDLVIWDMRILHSGNTQMPRFFYDHPLPIGSKREMQLRRFGLMRKEEKDRLAMFFAYGGDREQVMRFHEFTNAYKDDFIEGWTLSPINKKIVEEAKQKGLEIIPPIPAYIRD